ncbi:MAG: hypothetical protein U0744_07330 [Gemmataceae bacterium]
MRPSTTFPPESPTFGAPGHDLLRLVFAFAPLHDRQLQPIRIGMTAHGDDLGD